MSVESDEAKVSPIIVIGMHRSGTTLVTKILKELDIYIGAQRDHNEEDLFFQQANEWLLRQCGASWDWPEAFVSLESSLRAREQITRQLRSYVFGPSFFHYLGRKRFLRLSSSHDSIDGVWGWKDPRNSITLPIWLDLFPAARVIHVRRHGVDVSASLVARAEETIEVERSRLDEAFTNGEIHTLSAGRVIDSTRCLSLEGGFGLWEWYVTRNIESVDRLRACAMELTYESLVSEPLDSLSKLRDFVGVGISDETLIRASALVRQDGVRRYRDSSELSAFAAQMQSRLTKFGY